MTKLSRDQIGEALAYLSLWHALHEGNPEPETSISVEDTKNMANHIIASLSSYVLSLSAARPISSDITAGLEKLGLKLEQRPAGAGQIHPSYCICNTDRTRCVCRPDMQ